MLTLSKYLFENQIEAVQEGIINEVQRVAGGDPRLYISQVNVYPQLNGMLIEKLPRCSSAIDSKMTLNFCLINDFILLTFSKFYLIDNFKF